jgi:hypothetical protein
VASTGYCDPGRGAVTAYVPSSDKKSCAVKTCKLRPFEDDRFFGFVLIKRGTGIAAQSARL